MDRGVDHLLSQVASTGSRVIRRVQPKGDLGRRAGVNVRNIPILSTGISIRDDDDLHLAGIILRDVIANHREHRLLLSKISGVPKHWDGNRAADVGKRVANTWHIGRAICQAHRGENPQWCLTCIRTGTPMVLMRSKTGLPGVVALIVSRSFWI